MDSDSTLSTTQDWTLFGLRWVVLVAVCATLIMTGTPNNLVLRAFSLGAFANLLLMLVILVPPIHKALTPVAMIGNWVIIFTLVNLEANILVNTEFSTPMLLVGTVSSMLIVGMLRFGGAWGVVDTIGGIIAMFGAMLFVFGTVQFVPMVQSLAEPLLTLALVVVVGSVSGYVLSWQRQQEKQQLTEMAGDLSDQARDIRDRTHAISEMANTLNYTLNYERVLDAALNVGQFALKDQQRGSFTGAVLLYRPGDNQLHVVNGRALARPDEHRTTPGREGLIGQTLTRCVPTFGGRMTKDPELQYFLSFQRVRSTLCIPLRAGFDNYGVLLFGSREPNAFGEEYTGLLEAVGTQATVALQNAVLYGNLAEEKERIIEVEEEARKKLARDLHDGPTQTVSAIAMRLNTLQSIIDKNPGYNPTKELIKVEELARQTTKEIRHMLFTLRPLMLESQGLGAALEQLADKMEATYDQAVAVRVSPEAEARINSYQQGVLFYIAEEAVNNARKHAQAKIINVRVMHHEDVVLLEVSDNGVGFDTSAVGTNYEDRGSLGMVNMRERAELLEATIELESKVGRGTTISVVVPVTSGPFASAAKRPKRRKDDTRERFLLTPMR